MGKEVYFVVLLGAEFVLFEPRFPLPDGPVTFPVVPFGHPSISLP